MKTKAILSSILLLSYLLLPASLFAANDLLRINVTKQTNTSLTDEIVLYFDSAATSLFDPVYDAKKFPPGGSTPMLYTIDSAGQFYSINAQPLLTNLDVVIPMGLAVRSNGIYDMTIKGTKVFNQSSQIYLEDLKLNVWQDLRLDSTYSFNSLTTDDSTRFLLHFTPPVQLAGTDWDCFGALGNISINQPGSLASWAYTVTNSDGDTVGSNQNFSGTDVLTNLDTSTYTIVLVSDSGYILTQQVTIGAAIPVDANFTANPISIFLGDTVLLINTSTGETGNTWYLGDGTVLTDMDTIKYAYANTGMYDIKILAYNDLCMDSTTISVNVQNEYYIGGTATATSCDNYLWAQNNQTYSSSGTYADTVVYSGTDTVFVLNLTINSSSSSSISETACGTYTAPDGQTYTSSGNYTATITNSSNCDSIIAINLTINDPNAPPCVSAIRSLSNSLNTKLSVYPNPTTGRFIISAESGALSDLTIEVSSVHGKRIQSNYFEHFSQSTIDIDGPAGVYFVKATNAGGNYAIYKVIKN